MVPNLILDVQENHLDSFGVIQVLQRSHSSQTSNWSGSFFATWYKKPTLMQVLLQGRQKKIDHFPFEYVHTKEDDCFLLAPF